mmetsp:Transcript_19878/g.42813  ORF Transcript_19878/g.42813 Transcript_19878/m.42813 type:complete len:279 (+) Transcript_19878:632-1468(+)
MFQERIQDSAHTKRRLDDRRGELDFVNLLFCFGPSHHLFGNLKSFDRGLSVLLQCLGDGCKIFPVFGHAFQDTRNNTLVRLERLAQQLAVKLEFADFNLYGFVQLFRGDHGCLGGLTVDFQIIARAIRVTDAFHPSIRRLDFQIPTVGSIVGHFGCQVLSETQTLGIHTNLFHVQLCASHKVRQRLVVDEARFDRLATSHLFRLSRTQLVISAKQYQFLFGNRAKAGMILILGVDKMFNLGHAEFSHAQQTGPRGDFVAEPRTNLCRGKGRPASVQVQ